MKKIGIVGCGAIGSGIAAFLQKKMSTRARIVALCDVDRRKAGLLASRIKPRPLITDIERLIEESDLVIESAGIDVSGKIAESSVRHGKDALIMSTGGLLKHPSVLEKAKKKGCNIYIPSGAICGLDGLQSARCGKIKSVSLTTRKPPKGLSRRGIKKETVIFKGDAENAIRRFPQNINVAATLSIMGIGPRRTRVRIITSPEYKTNTHEIEVRGDFGRLMARTENIPSRENPKTSQLAIFSALAKLKEVI